MSANSKFLAGVILGAAAGAAIGYLLTTDKGKEILNDLKTFASNAGDEVKSKMKKFESEVDAVVDKASNFTT